MIVKPNVHIAFNCRDLEKSISFYTEILGCKEAFTLYYGDLIPEEPERLSQMDPVRLEELTKLKDVKWIVYLEWRDGFFIELFNEVTNRNYTVPDPAINFGYTHFAMVVDDAYAFYEEFIARGGREYIMLPPQPSLDGNINMWFFDPDKNRIEVQQYTEHSLQLTGAKRKPAKLFG